MSEELSVQNTGALREGLVSRDNNVAAMILKLLREEGAPRAPSQRKHTA